MDGRDGAEGVRDVRLGFQRLCSRRSGGYLELTELAKGHLIGERLFDWEKWYLRNVGTLFVLKWSRSFHLVFSSVERMESLSSPFSTLKYFGNQILYIGEVQTNDSETCGKSHMLANPDAPYSAGQTSPARPSISCLLTRLQTAMTRGSAI